MLSPLTVIESTILGFCNKPKVRSCIFTDFILVNPALLIAFSTTVYDFSSYGKTDLGNLMPPLASSFCSLSFSGNVLKIKIPPPTIIGPPRKNAASKAAKIPSSLKNPNPRTMITTITLAIIHKFVSIFRLRCFCSFSFSCNANSFSQISLSNSACFIFASSTIRCVLL